MGKLLSNFMSIIFLSFPLILGSVVYFLKIDKAVSWVESINSWFTNKRKKIAEKDSFTSKWVLKPALWVISKIMELTEKLEDKYLRSAVRISSYLYFVGIAAYISMAIAFAIIAIAIALWILFAILDEWLGGEKSSYTVSRIREKKIYDTRGFFSKQVGKINDKGRIYDTTGVFDKQLGKISDDGKIYNTKGIFDKQVGRIDGEGNVYDSTGLIDKRVAKIDEEGDIKDTKGIVDKKIGKLKRES